MASLNKCSNPIIKNPVKATNVQPNKALYKGDSNTALLDPRSAIKVKSIYPKKRQEVVKWYGWGYNDSGFHIKDNEVLYFKGKQYALDDCILPNFTDWVVKTFSLDIRNVLPIPTLPKVYPEPTNNILFVEDIKNSNISYSQEGLDRYIRCHGQTLHEIYYICNNRFKRIPDMVTWPLSHDEVKCLVMMAHKYNVVLIPYGGGTSVSGAITCPQREKRMICVVDTSQMNRLLWLNKENLTACFEAGIVGQDLERALKEQGLTLGHEPDSIELSTLGGWVATRASGMKKNVYGNIEDLVISVKLVTACGDVLERISNAPRISCGPDFNHIVLGSEGTLGIITEVVVKLRPIPKVKRYGSYVFPDFESGVEFMHEVAHRRCQPASVRLMDNEQFKMGQNLKPVKSCLGHFADSLKKTYLTTFKRLDLNKICAATLLFEGEEKQVEQQATVIHEIAKQFKGISGGAENGERGYILTFIIGYLRDIGIRVGIIGESFETSVPWDRCSTLCHNVKKCIENECLSRGIRHFITSCRVTQTYDVGACVYFYFSFRSADIPNPLETFEAIEVSARNEILVSGGSISHHHGVGKLRNQWYTSTVTETGVALYKAAKRQLDPKNIFAVGNLLPEEETAQKQQQQHHVQAKL